MMQVELGPLGNPTFAALITRTLFTAEECRQIVDLTDETRWTGATVTTDKPGEAVYDPKVRSVKSQAIPFDGSWPSVRLGETISEINADAHRFRLTGIPPQDRPSVLRYTADTADHFRPHTDVGPNQSTRKLTFIVQLSSSSDYSGGDLILTDRSARVSREQGTLVVFPSFLTHVVSPVVRGARFVLVGWVHGPAFS